MKNVLVESTKSKFQVLAQKPANVLKRIKGVLSDFGTNRNGRIYPRELWENVINSDYVKEMINSHGLVGELDHPEERLEISLQEVSHIINDMWIEGDKVIGIIDILPTPNGKIVNELLDYGTDIGISSRGAGSVGPDNVVDPDYQFITFDFVARPSCEAARLNTILEGVKVDLETNSADKVKSILESYKEELKEDTFTDMVKELHGYIEADPRRISQDLKSAIKSNNLDDYLKSKAAMSDEEIKEFKDRYKLNESAKDIKYNIYYNNEVGPNYVTLDLYDTVNNLSDAKKMAQELADRADKETRENDLLDNGCTYIKKVIDGDEEDEVYLTFKPKKKVNEDVDANKEKFTNFCKGKVKDLGTTFVQYFDRKGKIKIAFMQEIRDYGMCMVLDPQDCAEILDVDYENLSFITSKGDFVATPMISTDLLVARLEFVEIDKSFYKDILKYWDDLGMSYNMEEESELNETTIIKESISLNEAMSDQEVYKVVLNWYKDQIEAGKMTLNQCYELLSDKAKVSLNKLVDQSKIRESIMTREVNKILKEDEEFKPNGVIDDLKKPKYDVDLEVESPLELNTGVLPVLDTDTYSRDEWLYDDLHSRYEDEGREPTEEEEREYYKVIEQNMIDYGTPIVEDYIKKVLPSATVKGTKIYHPKQYNYSSDELEFIVNFNVKEYSDLEDRTVNDPEFSNYLKENYKSSSGFISYLADNIDEFYQQDGWKRFVQVVMFNLRDEDFEETNSSYWEDIISNS